MGKKIKVLIIDDEKDFTLFVKLNLEQTGRFEVLVANEGEKGIELARESLPAVILLDVLMPSLPGPEVARRILDDPRTSKIPIIFLTAIVDKKDLGGSSVREVGGRHFLAKPVTTEGLIAAIENVISA